MKTILTVIAAAAAMNLAAFAGDLTVAQVSNGHGQSTFLYRTNPPSVALFVAGRGIGADYSPVTLKTETKSNGHGQTAVSYRAE